MMGESSLELDEQTPQWTAELRLPSGGQDHLGLGAVASGQILGDLAPGVNVLTIHPGYYTFYSWVLHDFWSRDKPRTRAAWRKFYRSREFIFSLACNMCEHPDFGGQLPNIVGSGKTADLASSQPEGGRYSVATDYIKEPLGGYGLYYRPTMAWLGLIYPSPDNKLPIDVTTEIGKRSAEAFADRIANTTYAKRYLDTDVIPRSAVEDYGQAACLCRLRGEGSPDLTVARETVLHGGAPKRAAMRRSTIRMMLDLAGSTSGEPLSDASFRQLLYYGATDYGSTWQPRDDLPNSTSQTSIRECWRGWRAYQAREFYAYALNGLWRWLIDWGLRSDGDNRPISLDAAAAALEKAIDFDALAEALGTKTLRVGSSSTLRAAVRSLKRGMGVPELESAADAEWFDQPFGLDEPWTEWALYETTERGRAKSEVLATACIALLLAVCGRFQATLAHPVPSWRYAMAGGIGRLAMSRFLQQAFARMEQGETLASFLRWILEDYVVSQHLRTAATKLPRNTYRFTREGDQLRFFNRPRPLDFSASRYLALACTVAGLGFVDPLNLENHDLTADGLALLEDGDLATS